MVDTEDKGDTVRERFTMGANGERSCERGGVGLTDLVGGVSGTGASGEEKSTGDALSGGVSDASGDELEELLLELLLGVEELLEEWDEVDFEKELPLGVEELLED